MTNEIKSQLKEKHLDEEILIEPKKYQTSFMG